MAPARTWSARFKSYLEANGITQLEVAIALRMSPSKIHYWLNGSTPREETRLAVEKWSKGKVPAAVPESKRTGTDN